MAVNGYNQVTTYTYDSNGDVTSDGSYNYTWNDEGQMKTAASVTHTYDGDGQRVEKSSGSYFWFTPGGMLLGETNTSGTTQNEYVYFGGARVAANVPTNTVYYYFSDQVGSLQLVTNSTGTVCYDSDNTPNGYKWSYITTCAQEFGLAGMKLEAEAPIYHTWFRQYSDNAGRWISPDLLAGDVSNPQSLNRYAYVTNNPSSSYDPLGLDQEGGTCAAFGDNFGWGVAQCPSGGGWGGGGGVPPDYCIDELIPDPTCGQPSGVGQLGRWWRSGQRELGRWS